jgi:streptogramin lyase
MYPFRSEQTRAICLLSLIVGFVPIAVQSAPSLLNVNVTSGGENSVSVLTANLNNGGGGVMTFRVDWGDGTPIEIFSYPATSPSISNHFHYYQDDNPTGTSGDFYTLSLMLSNNVGFFATNLTVLVTNVPPMLTLNVNSPIEPGAPATLRGLEITEFQVPSAGSFPQGITAGPDGKIWFTETGSNRVGSLTTNGVITEFPIGQGARTLAGIAAGADGRLWFCANGSGQIGAITTDGVATMYTIPPTAGQPAKQPVYITRGNGPNMWYSDFSYRIGRVTPTGTITEPHVYPAGINPWGIASGPDNCIYFTAFYSDLIGRYRQSDGATNYFYLEPFSGPNLITRGPDGAMWFTQFQSGKIGRLTTNGVLTEAFIARSLPWGITAGPEGAIWYTETRSNSLVRLTTDGSYWSYWRYHLALSSNPREIVTGPDGALWFTMPGRDRIGRMRYTTAGNVVLSGNLNDPGNSDPHRVTIDWGDGSPVQTVDLEPGIASFHLAHTYSGSQPSYIINVTATDDDAGSSSASTTVVVNAIEFTSITRSGTGEVRLKGVGADGRTITIETSTDLQNWSGIGTANSVSNQFEFVHPGSTGTSRFYRGKLP